MLIIQNADISTGIDNETKTVTIVTDHGKIVSIEDVDFTVPADAQMIDAKGCLVLPGAIDPHVHFDTPGYEEREDFAHGTRAAAAGGVTTVIDMPDTCVPTITNVDHLKAKNNVIQKMAYVDYALWAGMSANTLRDDDWQENMATLWEAGVVGFKSYLISGMKTFQDLSVMELGQVMQKANDLGALVGLHAEDKSIIKARTEELINENKNTLADYYFSRSFPAETEGVITGLGLAKQTGCALHIVHLGSGKALNHIAKQRSLGVNVSAETCPHYLHFTHEDFNKKGAYLKTAPVVKTAEDREALWYGLIDGHIDFLATDHAPCSAKEKENDNAWDAYGGMPGVELLLPYLFSMGYMKQKLTLEQLINLTSTNAAKRFGLFPQKGSLAVGSDADLVIIDPKNIWAVHGQDMHSKAKWTCFEGMSLMGKIMKTLVRGLVVYDADEGIVGEAGYGNWITRLPLSVDR
ncbi:MAG: allantoinase AllB [bacterium]